MQSYSNVFKTSNKVVPVTLSVLASIQMINQNKEKYWDWQLAMQNIIKVGYCIDFQYFCNKLRACTDCYKSLKDEFNSIHLKFKQNFFRSRDYPMEDLILY